jgi:hypothetical protein
MTNAVRLRCSPVPRLNLREKTFNTEVAEDTEKSRKKLFRQIASVASQLILYNGGPR